MPTAPRSVVVSRRPCPGSLRCARRASVLNFCSIADIFALDAVAIVPSTKKVGGIGTGLDVPLTNINAIYVRSHFDAIEVRVQDAPRADELVVVLAMATGGRIHARVGGLAAADITEWNGLR